MATKKPGSVYRDIGKGLGNFTKALSSLQDANIKIRKNKTKPILKGTLNMSDDEIDNYIKFLMKEK